MRFREHRGSLEDSLKTTVELKDGRALLEYATGKLGPFPPKSLRVKHYCFDERVGWDTHIVMIKGYGVFGFTDGPVEPT